MSKISIDQKAIDKIKYFAHIYFMNGRFLGESHDEIQIVCILNGLYDYLKSEGKEVEWEIKKSN